jgi:cytochrome c oxidase assembly protein subunit 15
LVHRTFGYVVALFALVIGGLALARGEGAARIAGATVGAVALVQVLLGVLTVLAASPLSLSLMHQAGGVALWAAALVSARLAWR